MSHTPAPWAFIESPAYGYSTLWNPDTREEILVPDGQNDADRPEVWMGEELTDANKALIEAAPVLLSALTKLLAGITELIGASHSASAFLDISIPFASALEEAEAAIALTKGDVA